MTASQNQNGAAIPNRFRRGGDLPAALAAASWGHGVYRGHFRRAWEGDELFDPTGSLSGVTTSHHRCVAGRVVPSRAGVGEQDGRHRQGEPCFVRAVGGWVLVPSRHSWIFCKASKTPRGAAPSIGAAPSTLRDRSARSQGSGGGLPALALAQTSSPPSARAHRIIRSRSVEAGPVSPSAASGSAPHPQVGRGFSPGRSCSTGRTTARRGRCCTRCRPAPCFRTW